MALKWCVEYGVFPLKKSEAMLKVVKKSVSNRSGIVAAQGGDETYQEMSGERCIHFCLLK